MLDLHPRPALFLQCQMRKGEMLGGESVGAKAFGSTVNSPGLLFTRRKRKKTKHKRV